MKAQALPRRRGENAVEYAVRLVGGKTKASHICDSCYVTVYRWCKQGRIPDGSAAAALSKATGVPVAELAPPLRRGPIKRGGWGGAREHGIRRASAVAMRHATAIRPSPFLPDDPRCTPCGEPSVYEAISIPSPYRVG